MLYEERKIGVANFSCCHQKSCEKAAGERSLTTGAEAHVGRRYGDPIRLVIVSLDTGGGASETHGENLESRRSNIEKQRYENTNRYMKGTIDVLRSIYAECQEELLLPRFAMINSAKCAGRDKDKSVVPDQLYKNCRKHGLAELDALDAELIVTQGAKAREMIKCQYVSKCDTVKELEARIPSRNDPSWCGADVRSWILNHAKEYLRLWKHKYREAFVFVLETPHPSTRSSQWYRFKRISLPPLAHVIRNWLIPPLAKYKIPTNNGSGAN